MSSNKNDIVEGELVPADEVVQLLPIPAKENLPSNPIEMLAVAVTQGQLNVESMKALMDLEKEYRAMQAKVEFDTAVVKFAGLKKAIPHNRKGKTAGKAPFSYADFPQVVGAITPWMKKAGLSFSHTQDPPTMEGPRIVFINVRCILKAKSGHSEEAEFPAIPDEKLRDYMSPSQHVQLAITYAKRQSLSMVLGLATGEDTMLDEDAVTDRPTEEVVYYSEEDFKKNYPAWQKLVESGNQTAGDIRSLLSSKGRLSDSQIERLKTLGKGSEK